MPVVSNSDYVVLTMSTGRKMLMFEWVRHHLEKNTFAEMKYINDSKSAFQVPWIHKSNRKWNENAAAVFKAWAEYKGKEENFSFTRAKTNFRMAMKYQPNIKEVKRSKRNASNDKTSRGTKRKNPDEGKCVKVYEIVQSADVATVKKKVKRPSTQCSATTSDCCSQDCNSSSLATLPSSSSQEKSESLALPIRPENALTVDPEQLSSSSANSPEAIFDRSALSGFASNTIPNFFDDEFRDLFVEDSNFIKLPSYQEFVGKEPSAEISKLYSDHPPRYLPLQPIYESISDQVVSSSDDSYKINCSSEHFPSDDASSSGESFSLYSYTKWSQDLDSPCQVSSSINYTDDAHGYGFSDIEAFERMESYVEELLVRNFC